MPFEQFEKILVTGGSGFIGSALVKALVAKGKRPLVADLQVDENSNDGSCSIARIDLTDSRALRAVVLDFEPDLTIHLVGATIRDPALQAESDAINFEPAKVLLDSMVEIGAGNAVLMSTAAEYGDNSTPFNESMKPRPISPYAKSKARATEYATEANSRSRFHVTVLRTFTAYGPGQPPNMFLSQVVRHAVLNRHFSMSDGTQRRDMIYIDDVISAICAASAPAPRLHQIINIGSGRPISLRTAAKYIWDQCSADPELLIFGDKPSVGDDAVDTWADISLAGQLLNWKPLVSFEDGVAAMIAAERQGRSQ